MALIAACGFAADVARAQLPSDRLPEEFRNAGVTEHLGETAPLDVHFLDETGKDVTLREYLKSGRPIILTPIYIRCPQLCNLVLNGLVNGLQDLELSAGKDFEIVSFSFDHREGPELAEVKKRAYLTQYKRDTAADGWHFLTGTEANIRALCEGIGFGYTYVPEKEEYAHSATILFLTPEGKIARYVNDVEFKPETLKFALVEASQGGIGSPMDRFLMMWCFHYDPLSKSYAASARKIMQMGGVATLALMLAGFSLLWWKSAHPRSDLTMPPDQEHNAQEIAAA